MKTFKNIFLMVSSFILLCLLPSKVSLAVETIPCEHGMDYAESYYTEEFHGYKCNVCGKIWSTGTHNMSEGYWTIPDVPCHPDNVFMKSCTQCGYYTESDTDGVTIKPDHKYIGFYCDIYMVYLSCAVCGNQYKSTGVGAVPEGSYPGKMYKSVSGILYEIGDTVTPQISQLDIIRKNWVSSVGVHRCKLHGKEMTCGYNSWTERTGSGNNDSDYPGCDICGLKWGVTHHYTISKDIPVTNEREEFICGLCGKGGVWIKSEEETADPYYGSYGVHKYKAQIEMAPGNFDASSYFSWGGNQVSNRSTSGSHIQGNVYEMSTESVFNQHLETSIAASTGIHFYSDPIKDFMRGDLIKDTMWIRNNNYINMEYLERYYYLRPDVNPPEISISASDSTPNILDWNSDDWYTVGGLRFKGKDNYCKTLYVTIMGEDDEELYSGSFQYTGSSSTPTFDEIVTLGGEIDINGKQLSIELKDTYGNTMGYIMPIYRIDNKLPVNNTIPGDKNVEWSKSRVVRLQASDKGIGTQAGGNVLYSLTGDSMNSSEVMLVENLSQGKYYVDVEIQADDGKVQNKSIDFWLRDSLNTTLVPNKNTVIAYNLDGQKPGISDGSVELEGSTATLNFKVTDYLGSGVLHWGYATEKNPDSVKDWVRNPTGNTVNNDSVQSLSGITESGIYYVYCKDYVGNISNPIELSVVLDYSVVYKPNGGVGSDISDKVKVDASYIIKNNIYTKTGYHFIGWNTESNGLGQSYASGSNVVNLTQPGGVKILYAQWEPNTYEVRVYPNKPNSATSEIGKKK